MSVETFIGWRYLKAKRKQAFISIITLISVAGVALGVSALIVVIAVMSGFEEDLKSKILGVNAHITILKSGKPLDNYRELAGEIRKAPGVVSVEPFIIGQVMLGGTRGVTGTVLRAVDPEITHLRPLIKAGSIDALNNPQPTILLGKELAKQIDAYVGDSIKVVAPLGRITPLGARVPKIESFEVGGFFASGMYEFDTTLAFVSLRQAQDFLNVGASVTGLEVRVDDVYRADRIRERILAEIGDDYQAKDWMEMNRNLFSALKLEKVAMFIILTLTVLVAAFNIISTLTMVVMEKTRDIAILKSMGATRTMIMKIFMFQGTFVGIVGTVFGLLGGIGLGKALERWDIVKLPESIYYVTRLPIRVETLDVAAITVAAVLISFLATFYPSWQAARLNPVEALRYE